MRSDGWANLTCTPSADLYTSIRTTMKISASSTSVFPSRTKSSLRAGVTSPLRASIRPRATKDHSPPASPKTTAAADSRLLRPLKTTTLPKVTETTACQYPESADTDADNGVLTAGPATAAGSARPAVWETGCEDPERSSKCTESGSVNRRAGPVLLLVLVGVLPEKSVHHR